MRLVKSGMSMEDRSVKEIHLNCICRTGGELWRIVRENYDRSTHPEEMFTDGDLARQKAEVLASGLGVRLVVNDLCDA